jgi:hypothetical protein
MIKKYDLSIWLNSIAIADSLEKKIYNYKIGYLDDLTVRSGLNNLSNNFKALYSLSEKNVAEFLEACGACVYLGLKVKNLDGETRLSLNSVLTFYESETRNKKPIDASNVIDIIEKGLCIAGQTVDVAELPRWIKPIDELTFRDLERYFGIRA